tara:strand:- start:301 stop:927 length:627 start_codon:yes stop_codon:yes gene_type:complete
MSTDNNDMLIVQNIFNNLKEVIKWATTKPDKLEKCKHMTIKQKRDIEKEKEKVWGNLMIGQTNNGQWTTKLGETLVFVILRLIGENPFKPPSINGFQPDWESDNYIWEVKTSNWWVDGTAGEKVLGTWIKYQEIPELYKKPLRIVCVAYQEEEMTNGKTPYFGNNISEKTKQVLELAKSWGIEYISFSQLISSINNELLIINNNFISS